MSPNPERSLDVLAVHGWGFDASFWSPWQKLVGRRATFAAVDRGYFGAPAPAVWEGPADALRMLLVHSMGLLFCEPDLLAKADLVVLFGCFRRFHSEGSGARSPSRRTLARMRSRLEVAPGEVLAAFHRNCGLQGESVPVHPSPPDVPLLRSDLELLDCAEVPLAPLRERPLVGIFHGDRDRIVPEARGLELVRELADNVVHLPVPRAGHGLPRTHADASWNRLRPHILTLPQTPDRRPA